MLEKNNTTFFQLYFLPTLVEMDQVFKDFQISRISGIIGVSGLWLGFKKTRISKKSPRCRTPWAPPPRAPTPSPGLGRKAKPLPRLYVLPPLRTPPVTYSPRYVLPPLRTPPVLTEGGVCNLAVLRVTGKIPRKFLR